MSYSNRGYLQGALGAVQVLTSAANIAKFLAPEQMDVLEISFELTTAVSSSASVVITVYNRTSPTVTASQVTLGTLTIPTGAAIGQIYYKAIEAKVLQGSTIEFDVTTDSSSTGGGYCGVKVGFNSENPLNVPNMVLSA